MIYASGPNKALDVAYRLTRCLTPDQGTGDPRSMGSQRWNRLGRDTNSHRFFVGCAALLSREEQYQKCLRMGLPEVGDGELVEAQPGRGTRRVRRFLTPTCVIQGSFCSDGAFGYTIRRKPYGTPPVHLPPFRASTFRARTEAPKAHKT